MSTSATTAVPPCFHVGLADYEHELATTRRVLERVPDAHLAWKPHAKSFSLGQLARHVAATQREVARRLRRGAEVS